MAITKNPLAPDAQAPYKVQRALYWAGDVQAVGAVLNLTKTEAADMLAAGKVIHSPEVAEVAPKAAKASKKAAD